MAGDVVQKEEARSLGLQIINKHVLIVKINWKRKK